MSGRLRKVDPTFDHLLAKYMKKKVVPHNRLIKQTKSKSDLCESKGRLNHPKSGATKIAWSSSSRDVVGTLDQGYPLIQHEDTVPTRLSLVTW
jgi:hypothetical protein